MNSGVVQMFKNILAETVYFAVKATKTVFMMQEGTCRFRPTCSQYTREALRVLPLYKAIPKIIHRVGRCHPRGGFGYDPVIPDSKTSEEKE